ncbi:hypothetical protein GPY51_17955 [Photorhabdus laumondii subsp. laumondii]|uniref:Uncharacterized protein n=1 Tax=Photorhabdus laumondii subsp. laumondii TaxID=141679 RepID=A0A6L9JP92_PHOLM|nr:MULTISPECIES: hypothetical protein [Photorhabdus]MCC8385024.1 hypothetical protein [Photorhabdus laumondii]MCC8389779.1 hypothetical protein [Photorhabdus laumondii]MCC8414448.1 hypothetical protein [Photorhabdus laumondii]MCZ1247706.1 hypothetical protein [Photorhabdus laumondii subsp. laumondii]NDK96138.1 hypothetical protein [Photorhabdus laumondii subsp. laumondii]
MVNLSAIPPEPTYYSSLPRGSGIYGGKANTTSQIRVNTIESAINLTGETPTDQAEQGDSQDDRDNQQITGYQCSFCTSSASSKSKSCSKV